MPDRVMYPATMAIFYGGSPVPTAPESPAVHHERVRAVVVAAHRSVPSFVVQQLQAPASCGPPLYGRPHMPQTPPLLGGTPLSW